MSIVHAKCPLCGGEVYRFGNRRRRCSQCGHTYSIRPKKRGRKCARTGRKLPQLILLEKHSARQLTARYGSSSATLRYHVRKQMTAIVQRPVSLTLPDGDLVLLVDGLWSTFQDKYWVLYNMAIKPVNENLAYFLDPVQRCGRENARGWEAALSTLSWDLKERIRALISDGLPGFEAIARRHWWHNQFCHWHLLTSLESKLGRRRRVLGSRWLRERIYVLVREALVTTDEERLRLLTEQLKQLTGRWDCTRPLRWTVSEFLSRANYYRAYLRYPELRLPTTTGAIESMHGLLREAIGSVNNPEAVLLRATAFLRLRRSITCNGSVLQQN